jgi:hypothetical protein
MFFLRAEDAVTAYTTPPSHYRPQGMLRMTPVVYLGDRIPYQPEHKESVPLYNVSVLKSNLQKCIRRGKGNEAAATARQLLFQDPNELLRRLPILMCEDTMLCAPLFCKLVWLMAAVSKGYRIHAGDAQTVYDAVQTMIDAPGRYNGAVEPAHEPASADPADPTVDAAFRIRIAYGGMASDCDLLERLRRRFATLPQIPPRKAEPPEPFDPAKHLLPEAIDYHCFPALLTEHPEIPKAAIWWHWSSPNARPVVGDGAAELVAHEKGERERYCLTHRSVLERYAAGKIAWVATSAGAPPTKIQGVLDMFLNRTAR